LAFRDGDQIRAACFYRKIRQIPCGLPRGASLFRNFHFDHQPGDIVERNFDEGGLGAGQNAFRIAEQFQRNAYLNFTLEALNADDIASHAAVLVEHAVMQFAEAALRASFRRITPIWRALFACKTGCFK